jgi:hypothetical protein
VSMYSELLRKVPTGRGDWFLAFTDQQLQTLLQERRDEVGILSAGSVDRRHGRADVTAELALQLEYDRILLALFRTRGIASDPDRFGRHVLERRRLERALATAPSGST